MELAPSASALMANLWPAPRHPEAGARCPCGEPHRWFQRSPLSFGRYHVSATYTGRHEAMPDTIRVWSKAQKTMVHPLPFYAQGIPVFVFCLVQFMVCERCHQQMVRVSWEPGEWSRWEHYTSERMRRIEYRLAVETGEIEDPSPAKQKKARPDAQKPELAQRDRGRDAARPAGISSKMHHRRA